MAQIIFGITLLLALAMRRNPAAKGSAKSAFAVHGEMAVVMGTAMTLPAGGH
jgi:putative Ca2+/H+ antiporter (TMEM165/GDT1 family)